MWFFPKGKHEKSCGNYTVTCRHLATGNSTSWVFHSASAMRRFIRKMKRRKELVVDHFATTF